LALRLHVAVELFSQNVTSRVSYALDLNSISFPNGDALTYS